MKRKLFVLFSMLAIVAIAFTGCQKDQLIEQKAEITLMTTPSTPISEASVTPFIVANPGPGGNITCEQLGYPKSSDRVNYNDGAFDTTFPEGISVTTDGELVSWTSTFGIGAVIVKGSNAANVYEYDPQAKSDQNLAAPLNSSGKPAGLSNLTFCWIPENACWDWKEETAWAGNFSGGGSAWWLYIDTTEGDGTYPIYAGQKLVVGANITIVNGLLTINLGENLDLQEVSQAVKIEGYINEIPKRRPNAGQFTTYKGDFPEEGVNVSGFRYIAIHLDALVKVFVECPE